MPLRRHPEPFSHRDWLYEIKHDGFRALAFVKDGTSRLVSRNGNAFHSFATLNIGISEELRAEQAVLDGEIVCLDEHGRSQFGELLFRRGEPRFYAFDLLWVAGKDLRYDPLHERKRQLRSLVTSAERLLYCDHIEQHGARLFEFACKNDLEGIVAKPRNSPYQFSESSTYWRKIKNREYSQQFGRDDLFPRDKKPIGGSWTTCALVCAEAEM